MGTHFINTVDNRMVKLLMQKYSSPLFIAHAETIEDRVEEINRARQKYYPNSSVFYSLKTNYLPGIASLLKGHHINIEVVSGFEYWLAKKLGYKGSQIIFNGPEKKDGEIKEALKDGVLIHLDNEDELKRAISIARNSNESYPIGIRVNIDLTQSLSETDNKLFEKFPNKGWRRFGFNINGKEAYKAAQILSECHNLKLKSIHVHLGSRIRSPHYYSLAAQYISEFISKIRAELKLDISQVDLGGGYYETPMEEYLAPIATIFKSLNHNLHLVIEPGTYIINDGFSLATSVVHTSRFGNLQKLTVNASTSILFPGNFSSLPAEVLVPQERRTETIISTIFGNSCVSSDILSREVYLPQLNRDDIIIFPKVGAYTISKAEQFIFPRPAVVLIKKGVGQLLRARESYEDMIKLDYLPNEN